MSANIMPGSSAGGTRASSSTLMPSRTFMASPLPVGVRGLDGGFPELGVMAGEDTSTRHPRERLQSLDRVHGARGIPHDARGRLLVDGLLPVAGVAREDHGPRLGQLDQERLMPRG